LLPVLLVRKVTLKAVINSAFKSKTKITTEYHNFIAKHQTWQSLIHFCPLFLWGKSGMQQR